jgi:NAD-dependent dihydropyrimidine dehydrogenase PreA subunit
MGVFIQVRVDEKACAPDGGAKLVEVCPVNVFSLVEGRIVTEPEAEDECTLCGLCLSLYPKGSVTVRRLYRE